MLKEWIQLFAEKFLTNKKEWVSEQSTRGQFLSTVTVTADSEYHNFIMPCTGYAVLRGYGVAYIDLDGCVLINGGTSANFNLVGTVYAKKGQNIAYSVRPSSDFASADIRIYKAQSAG